MGLKDVCHDRVVGLDRRVKLVEEGEVDLRRVTAAPARMVPLELLDRAG